MLAVLAQSVRRHFGNLTSSCRKAVDCSWWCFFQTIHMMQFCTSMGSSAPNGLLKGLMKQCLVHRTSHWLVSINMMTKLTDVNRDCFGSLSNWPRVFNLTYICMFYYIISCVQKQYYFNERFNSSLYFQHGFSCAFHANDYLFDLYLIHQLSYQSSGTLRSCLQYIYVHTITLLLVMYWLVFLLCVNEWNFAWVVFSIFDLINAYWLESFVGCCGKRLSRTSLIPNLTTVAERTTYINVMLLSFGV